MTNKKFKVAAMSMALTACVAAQPLIANAADEVDAVSNEPAPQSEEGSTASVPVAVASEGSGTEGNGTEGSGTGNESNQSDGANQESTGKKEEAFGEHVDVNYNHGQSTTDKETALQRNEVNEYPLSREEAIQTVASSLGPKDVIVSTTGMISRELFEYRAAKGQGHERDFLTVGSMGHASQIALGIALERADRKVWCFDGDGAVLMHLGSMAIVADKAPANFVHVVFNNGAHDSVGGQPTVGLKVSLTGIAKAVGYKEAVLATTAEELAAALNRLNEYDGPVLLEVRVHRGNRKDLGRPTTTPVQNRDALMSFLNKFYE